MAKHGEGKNFWHINTITVYGTTIASLPHKLHTAIGKSSATP